MTLVIKSMTFGTQPEHLQRFCNSLYTLAGTMICQGSSAKRSRMTRVTSRSVMTLQWQTSIADRLSGGIKRPSNMNVNVR